MAVQGRHMAFWQDDGSGDDVDYGEMGKNPCFGCGRMRWRKGREEHRRGIAQVWFTPFAKAMKAFVPRTIDSEFRLSGTSVVLTGGGFKHMVPSYNQISI